MGRRTALVSVAMVLALLAEAVPAEALPAKEYRVQESTLCMNWQGCPRMLRNAVTHANQFCQAEGGVLTGGQKRDYTCEQRGIYCVVTGRIECRGRFDPTQAPGQTGDESAAPRPTKTCLDAECQRFVSHAPGETVLGTHACPAGYALAGVSGTGNNIVCQALAAPTQEMHVQRDLRADGLLACPTGMLARGVDEDRSVLLCIRAPVDLSDDAVQDEKGNLGLQVCTGEGEAYAPRRFVVWVDPGRERLVCATAKPR